MLPASPAAMRRIAKPLLFATAIIWGSTFVLTKNALDGIPPFFLVSIRFLVASALLSLVCARKWKQCTRDYLWRGAVNGLVLFGAYAFQTVGLTMTTPSNNAFLTMVYCVMVPFVAWAVMGTRPDRYNLSAAVLCMVGVALVSLNEALTINRGDFITLVGAVFSAGNIVAVARLSKGKDVMLLTTLQFIFTGLLSLLSSLFTETISIQALLRPEVFWPMAYLSVLATAVALLFQNIGSVWTDPASAAIILSLESVFGVMFAILLYGDPVTPRLLLGFALIFLAVICSETKFSFLRKKAQDNMIDP